MRTIGLIGGLSWESTVIYYRIINERVRESLGGSHSADSLVWSVDFTRAEELIVDGRWDEVGDLLGTAGSSLQAMGADLLLICSNTFSRVNDEVRRATTVPVLHIADAVADAVGDRGMRRVGLLGTRFTMAESGYSARLAARGIEVIVPGPGERELVHRVIFDELVRGVLSPSSRDAFVAAIAGLAARGAEAVVLGCTEIELLVSERDTAVPLLPSARLHAEAAAEFALAGAYVGG